MEDADIAIEVTSSSALENGHRVQLAVSWRDLTVAGAGLTLFLDTDLETRAVTGEVPPRVAALATPVVTEAEAIAAAEFAAGASAAGAASLQILDLAAIASEPRTALPDPGDGLVAGPFLGRMQFLLPSEIRTESGFAETRLAHHSEPGGNIWVSNFLWNRRPAMFEVTAPDGLRRQVILAFSRGWGDVITVATRRSD